MTTLFENRTHPILRYVQRAEELESQDQILSEFLTVLEPYNISFLIYVTVNAQKSDPCIWSNINIHQHPEAHYFFDPFLEYCCTTYVPTFTGVEFLDDYPYLKPEEKSFIQKAGTMGFKSGLAIPVRLENESRFGGFNFGTSLDRADFLNAVTDLSDKLSRACVLINQRLEYLHAASAANSDPSEIAGIAPPQGTVLTNRERDILFLLSQGVSRKDMARMSSLSPNTIGSYVKNIYAKLGVNNRSEATRLALEMGLKPPRFETHESP